MKLFFKLGYRWPNSRLTFLKELPKTDPRKRLILCQCDCGTRKSIILDSLQSGRTTSCGCYNIDKIIERRKVLSPVKQHWLYGRWSSIVSRCYCESSTAYKDYGLRGSRVCPEWRIFENFREWVEVMSGKKEADCFEVHRKDGNGPYSPSNCICISPQEHMKIEWERRKQNV